jgi:hypothetical protein
MATPYRTKARGTRVQLPDQLTKIFQPNRVTNAHYDYTLIQERIFNYVMFVLQAHIKRVMAGEHVQQLDIFKDVSEYIHVSVPLMAIAQPAQYGKVRESAKQLAGIVVSMKGKSSAGYKVQRFTGMFADIELPLEKQRSNEITIRVRKDVADHLLQIDRNPGGQPYGYTSFMLEVANGAKNKYTSRIYKLCSSWKEKGGFNITLEELQLMLQLGPKYDYNAIKRRILEPVAEELKEKSDCWFEVTETLNGKKVIALSFKVITPDLIKQGEILKNSIINMLRTHFLFNDILLARVSPIFHEQTDYTALQYKILDLMERKRTTPKDKMPHPQAYVITSLLKEFAK